MGLRVRSTHEPTNEEREHDTRCYLMINLECIIGPPVNQALWAILWHAEISRLLACGRVIAKDQLERVKEKKLAAIANLVAQKWRERTPYEAAFSYSVTCAITGRRLREVDRRKLLHFNVSDSMWLALEYFWTEKQVDIWKQAYDDSRRVGSWDVLPEVYDLHRKGYFGLKPLSLTRDKKRLQVQFFWLGQPRFNNNGEVLAAFSVPPPRLGRLFTTSAGPFNSKLLDKGKKRIESGRIYTFKSTDPVSRPLPSMEFLELQWVLNCMYAESGINEKRPRRG